MRICRRFPDLDAVRSLPIAAALLAALAASCGLDVGGLAPSGAQGAPGAAGSGGASGVNAATGAGGTAEGPSGPGATTGAGGEGGAGGAVTYLWNSYGVVEETGTGAVFVLDVKHMKKATIKSYRGKSADDPGNTSDLTTRKTAGASGSSLDDLNWFYAPQAGGDFPYIGKSAKKRMEDTMAAPIPISMAPDAQDLQLHAPVESNVFVYAAFEVPVAGHYHLSNIAAHRVLTTGDHTTLQAYVKKGGVPSNKIGSPLRATKKQDWQLDMTAHDLQMLSPGDQILFEVGADGDSGDGDAIEVAWTIETTLP